jgi:hypothetical protein
MKMEVLKHHITDKILKKQINSSDDQREEIYVHKTSYYQFCTDLWQIITDPDTEYWFVDLSLVLFS